MPIRRVVAGIDKRHEPATVIDLSQQHRAINATALDPPLMMKRCAEPFPGLGDNGGARIHA
jgi:hypothetical protein